MAAPIIVAIDGPAGAGKSTIARTVAARLGCVYIDTGAMYRAVALWAVRRGTDWSDMHRLEQLAAESNIALTSDGRILLNGEDISEAIRNPDVSQGASKVAVVAGVRRAMVAKQRAIAEGQSVVMEGRDIGTVVFPEAQVKIYLDASPETRARRRALELAAKGLPANEQEIAAEMRQRDARDSSRADSPLRQAPDATYLDSSGLSVDEVVEAVLAVVRARTSNGKERKS